METNQVEKVGTDAGTSQHEVTYTAEAGISVETVKASAQFQLWLTKIQSEGRFLLCGVHIQSVDMFKGKVGFVKFVTDVLDASTKQRIPGIVFMRGGSVGILPVFKCKGKSYAVLTVQPRVPAGSFAFEEIPAGMLDGSGKFAGVAAAEMRQELGIELNETELIDLSALAGHTQGIFVSPGGTDETIRLFAYVKEVTEEELASMSGRCTGLAEEGEHITLKIVPLESLWSIADAKTIAAYALYLKFLNKSVPNEQ